MRLHASVATTVEQMKNMVLALRLSLTDSPTSLEEESHELLGQLDGVLGRLAAVARSSREAASPGVSGPPSASPPARGSCDVVEVLKTHCERHRRLFEPEIHFERQVDVGSAHVAASAQRVERAVLDLLLRARDLTPEGGTVRLRFEARDMFARLVVHVGGDPSSEPIDTGLELLAFWRRCLELGNLTVQTRPGQGTSFLLTLPLQGSGTG